MHNIKQWLMAMRQTPTWRAVKNESVGFAPEKTPRTRRSRAVLNVAASVLLLFGAVNVSFASTPDGQTPAQEDVCKQAGLSGKLYGLCNAYCEAQDCDLASQANKKSCGVLRSNFIKLGGTSLPCDKRAAVTIDKYVAGHRADDNTDLGPDLIVGQPLIWNVEIKNTGDFPLDPVTVTDDIPGLNCNGITTLGSGDTLTCTLEDIVKELQQSNTANVTATASNGSVVTGSDTSSYFGLASGITITKVTDKPTYEVGEPINFTLTILNTGGAALKNFSVQDNRATADSGDDFDPCVGYINGTTVLEAGGTIYCNYGYNAATQGQFTNIVTVGAQSVIDSVAVTNQGSAEYGVNEPKLACPCWNQYTASSFVGLLNGSTIINSAQCGVVTEGTLIFASQDSTVTQASVTSSDFQCALVLNGTTLSYMNPISPEAALICKSELLAAIPDITWCPQ